ICESEKILRSSWLKSDASLEGVDRIIPTALTTSNGSGGHLEFSAVWHRPTRQFYFETAFLEIVVGQDKMIRQRKMHRSEIGRHASRFLQGEFCQTAVINISLFHRRELLGLVESVVSVC